MEVKKNFQSDYSILFSGPSLGGFDQNEYHRDGVLRDGVLRDGDLRDGVLRDGLLRDGVLKDR